MKRAAITVLRYAVLVFALIVLARAWHVNGREWQRHEIETRLLEPVDEQPRE